MIRALLMIAIAGFVLSIASFSAAVAIGGPEALARGAWGWGRHNWDGDWSWRWDDDHHGRRHGSGWGRASGPTITREIAWSGRDAVEFHIPAEITYRQAPGPAKLVITGPKGAVDRVEVNGEDVRFNRSMHSVGRLKIEMTAPNVTAFGLRGSGRLDIGDYKQDRLKVDLTGSAEVTARGEAREVDLDISGSGEAHLGDLATRGASVDISGSGEATIAPTEWAELEISGSGEVDLLTNPPQLQTDISGSGHVRQGGKRSATPAAAADGEAT